MIKCDNGAPLYIQEKAAERLHFSWNVTKKVLRRSEIMGCFELQRIGTLHLFTSGSEVSKYHCTEKAKDRGGGGSGSDALGVCVRVTVKLRGMHRTL